MDDRTKNKLNDMVNCFGVEAVIYNDNANGIVEHFVFPGKERFGKILESALPMVHLAKERISIQFGAYAARFDLSYDGRDTPIIVGAVVVSGHPVVKSISRMLRVALGQPRDPQKNLVHVAE